MKEWLWNVIYIIEITAGMFLIGCIFNVVYDGENIFPDIWKTWWTLKRGRGFYDDLLNLNFEIRTDDFCNDDDIFWLSGISKLYVISSLIYS